MKLFYGKTENQVNKKFYKNIIKMFYNIFSTLSELCFGRNKPINKVSNIISDMEELAQDEIDKIFKYHNKKYCCY